MSRGCWTGTPVITSWKWSTRKWKNYPGLVRNSDKINAIFILTIQFHDFMHGTLVASKYSGILHSKNYRSPWGEAIGPSRLPISPSVEGIPRVLVCWKPRNGCWSRASTRFSAMAPQECAFAACGLLLGNRCGAQEILNLNWGYLRQIWGDYPPNSLTRSELICQIRCVTTWAKQRSSFLSCVTSLRLLNTSAACGYP